MIEVKLVVYQASECKQGVISFRDFRLLCRLKLRSFLFFVIQFVGNALTVIHNCLQSESHRQIMHLQFVGMVIGKYPELMDDCYGQGKFKVFLKEAFFDKIQGWWGN